MKNLISSGIIFSVVALFAPQIIQAQGTTYLSNLGNASTGSSAVGSDSWLAAAFHPGNSSGGYILDSVQIAMAGASGAPTGFTVMLYAGFFPGSRLASLSGSPNPSTAGVYDYTPATSLILAQGTYYNVVLTAGTPVANGAYEWSTALNAFNASDGWAGYYAGASFNYRSSDGLSWYGSTSAQGLFQYAINATPVPEPAISCLFLLGGLAFLWIRRKGG